MGEPAVLYQGKVGLSSWAGLLVRAQLFSSDDDSFKRLKLPLSIHWEQEHIYDKQAQKQDMPHTYLFYIVVS